MEAISLNGQASQVESMTKWYKLYSLIRKHGILKFTWLGLRHILRKTIGLDWWGEIFFERSLKGPIQEVVPKIKVLIMQATIDDLDKFKDKIEINNYERLQQKFRQSKLCFIALDGNRVVGQQWVSLDDHYDLDLKVTIPVNDKEGYLFDAQVTPEYRNNRLQSVLSATALKYLYEQGFDKATTVVMDNNTYSLKTCAAKGFMPKKLLFRLTIFGLRYHRWQKYNKKSD
jgi:ribosomal protein S18 acetylase RimI-like enzyme